MFHGYLWSTVADPVVRKAEPQNATETSTLIYAFVVRLFLLSTDVWLADFIRKLHE